MEAPGERLARMGGERFARANTIDSGVTDWVGEMCGYFTASWNSTLMGCIPEAAASHWM